MRWPTVAILCGVICSVTSQDPDIETPSLTIMARSTIYNVGENKAIFCKATHIPEPIEWYSPQGEKIKKQEGNARVYVEKMSEEPEKGEFLVPLIIRHIQITDRGNWTCKAGDYSHYIDMIVGKKVIIADRNVTMESEEGRTVKLSCKAEGNPAPDVSWYKDNQLIKDDNKYHTKPDHSLEIKKLTHMDVGAYVCKVRQRTLSHYTDKTVHLSVQHKPVLYNSHTQQLYTSKYKTEEVFAILNETKNITCSAIANPPPTFRWYRRDDNNDEEQNIDDPETVVTPEDGTNSVLILRMHDTSYLGQYRCSASNPKGEESVIYHVSLGTKPDPPDFVKLAVTNVTELTFNVTCSSCIMRTEDDVSPDPNNLPVLGYSFELVPSKKNYPADWDAENKISTDVFITDPDDTLFVVGSLTNGTEYHVRVCTLNAAGSSDWLELTDIVKTADDAFRMAATLLLVIASIIFTRCY